VTDTYYAIACPPAVAGADGAITATVRLSGEFDVGARDRLRAAVLGVVGAGAGRVVIDLTDVTFIDSETIRVLLDGYTAARRQGSAYRLAGAHGVVQRILDVMGLTELLDPESFGRVGAPAG
jgi:anti-sigma B factor antagonist